MSANGDIRVEGLTKRFGDYTAVDDVSFEVPEGRIFGFLGPNGAGKTTLIRMLTTLMKPTSGRAFVAGYDVVREPSAVRKSIGVVPQALTSDLDLTGYENMDIYGRFYGVPGKLRTERIRKLLDVVGLSGRAGDLVASYSGGMRRRLELARVLVHKPRIMFLDEPTIGLDPQSRRVVWDFLREFIKDDNITIFLTTHYMEEAEELSDTVAIIDIGRIIAMGSPDELKAELPGKDIVSIKVAEPGAELLQRLQGLPFVHSVAQEGDTIRINSESGAMNLPLLIDETRAFSQVLSATVHEQSLEDVFIYHTGKSIRTEEARKVSFFVGAGVPRRLG